MTASFSTAMSIFPFFILILISSMFPEPSDSLKLKLFHRSSLESPGYLNNLTAYQRIGKMFNQSRSRSQVLNHRVFPTRNLNQSTVKHGTISEFETPPIVPVELGGIFGYEYAVKIGIGTFPGQQPSYKEYYLTLDTASSLSWLQCEPCEQRGNHCYPQNDPVFSNVDSDTYTPFMVKDDEYDICKVITLIPHNPKLCYYKIEYQDESKSIGQVAYETFTFESDSPGVVTPVEDIVFGCGFDQVGFEASEQPPKISGIMGMDLGPYSLRKQIDEDDEGVSFSYCFQSVNDPQVQPPNTYLRFGKDIEKDRSSYLSTPFVGPPPGPDSNLDLYYIKVVDIMINNNRLMIDPEAFRTTIVDTGSPVTDLTAPAYEAVENSLKAMFDTNPNYKRMFRPDADRYCYDMLVPEGYVNLPTIQLILGGGSIYEVRPEQGFIVGDDVNNPGKTFFCLMIQPTASDVNILGGNMQINKRIIYDLENEKAEDDKFMFKNEDCANNP